MNTFLDFRSDTFTLPCEGMKKAMFDAPLGDDVFGEDPTVSKLENFVADMFGMEAGLFCPSGTMTNQIAIKCHTAPGDEVICSSESHIHYYEAGGIAMNSGASVRLIPGETGVISAEQIEAHIMPENLHFPNPSLVSLENTSNRGGGCCYNFVEFHQIKEIVNRNHLKLHLDGARVFNAIVERNESASDYGKIFDSISICLSKGLGAPVGSVLLGGRSFINKARRVRKVFGGGMRQSGILAAAGLFALENNINRMKDDHEHAKQISKALLKNELVTDILPVETNIVVAKLRSGENENEFCDLLKSKGILALGFGKERVRFITHLDLNASQIEKACDIIRSLKQQTSYNNA